MNRINDRFEPVIIDGASFDGRGTTGPVYLRSVAHAPLDKRFIIVSYWSVEGAGSLVLPAYALPNGLTLLDTLRKRVWDRHPVELLFVSRADETDPERRDHVRALIDVRDAGAPL